jgi:hypothetical protein
MRVWSSLRSFKGSSRDSKGENLGTAGLAAEWSHDTLAVNQNKDKYTWHGVAVLQLPLELSSVLWHWNLASGPANLLPSLALVRIGHLLDSHNLREQLVFCFLLPCARLYKFIWLPMPTCCSPCPVFLLTNVCSPFSFPFFSLKFLHLSFFLCHSSISLIKIWQAQLKKKTPIFFRRTKAQMPFIHLFD